LIGIKFRTSRGSGATLVSDGRQDPPRRYRAARRGVLARRSLHVALAVAHATLGVVPEDAPLQATIAFGDRPTGFRGTALTCR